MSTKRIKISEDFTPFPAGRFEKDGPHTGEGFRKNILLESIKNNDKVEIDFDGTLGYGSSFLEEAFGGLIREEGFTRDEILSKVTFISKRKSIVDSINEYLDKAQSIKDSE